MWIETLIDMVVIIIWKMLKEEVVESWTSGRRKEVVWKGYVD